MTAYRRLRQAEHKMNRTHLTLTLVQYILQKNPTGLGLDSILFHEIYTVTMVRVGDVPTLSNSVLV
jgi:hypothetical protein